MENQFLFCFAMIHLKTLNYIQCFPFYFIGKKDQEKYVHPMTQSFRQLKLDN